jgi:hypothetical protein
MYGRWLLWMTIVEGVPGGGGGGWFEEVCLLTALKMGAQAANNQAVASGHDQAVPLFDVSSDPPGYD